MHNSCDTKIAMNYAKRKGLEIINLYDEKDEPTYVMTKKKEKNIIKIYSDIKNDLHLIAGHFYINYSY